MPPSCLGATPVYTQQPHALDITTGQKISGRPVTIDPEVAGPGNGGTTITFDTLTQNQRAALALVTNCNSEKVHVAFSSHYLGTYH